MTEYNGWSNKQTWLATLWLDEYFHQEMQDGQEITAAHVKDTIDNMLADEPTRWGLFSDLLQDAIGRIGCYEIADHYLPEETSHE